MRPLASGAQEAVSEVGGGTGPGVGWGVLSWRRELDQCHFSTRNQVSDAFRQVLLTLFLFLSDFKCDKDS